MNVSAAGAYRLLIVVGCLLIFLIPASSAGSQAGPPPGVYTWEEAVALGLRAVKDFENVLGLPTCPPLSPGAGQVTNSLPVDDAPSCWYPPEDQGVLIGVPEPGAPEFAAGGAARITQGADYRFNGPYASFLNFEGGQNLAEVSDPSVCHTCPGEHFYSRIAVSSPAGHLIEVGWIESNHTLPTGDDQVVQTVVDPIGTPQEPALHPSWAVGISGETVLKSPRFL